MFVSFFPRPRLFFWSVLLWTALCMAVWYGFAGQLFQARQRFREWAERMRVLFEEFNDENARFYVLTVLRGGYRTEILRKVWFNRVDLNIARLQTYGPKGLLVSDVRLSDWEALLGDQEHLASTTTNAVNAFPRSMRLDRPHDDYELDLTITKLALNEDIPADRFHLEQPAGSELVRVGDNAEDKPR